MSKHYIGLEQVDMGIDYADCGPWRSYGLSFEGSNIEEALENASVFEVDQDGGELGAESLMNYGGEIYRVGEKIIKNFFTEQENLQLLRCS